MKKPKVSAGLTESQTAVWALLAAKHPRWCLPSELVGGGTYPGGASSIGAILANLKKVGIVESRPKGSKRLEWRTCPLKGAR